jgi:hypothetical protein
MSLKRFLALQTLVISLFACVLLSPPLLAAPHLLTRDEVTRFVATLPDVKAIGIREGLTASASVKSPQDAIFAIVKVASDKALRDELNGVVTRQGFSSVKDWSRTGKSIGQAYAHLTGAQTAALAKDKFDKHKDDLSKELDKLGLLSDKQKRKLMEKAEELREDLDEEPPAENVAIVKSMRKDIEASLK